MSHFTVEDINAIEANPAFNYFTPVLRDVLEYIEKPRSVCDVGCGNGVFTAVLKDWTGCQLFGVDGSEYALKQAKRLNFDELNEIGDFSTDSLPFEDDSFDLVINKDVLEHLIHPVHLAREIARITTGEGGYALIHVPNHFPIAGRLKLLFRNTIDPFNYFPDSRRWNFPHIRFFNKKDFLDLMLSAGLKPVANLCHHFASFPKAGKLLTKSMKNRLSRHNPNAFAEGFTFLFQK